MSVAIYPRTMLTTAQTFIQKQGTWLLLPWTFREVMGILLRGHWSSSICGPPNSDTRGPQAMLAEAITVAFLYALLAGVSIVALLLWLKVLEQRRELVRLQSCPPGKTAEDGNPPTGTSISVECFGKTSATAGHGRSNSPRRPNSERASSGNAIANADECVVTDAVTTTHDEHILVKPFQTVDERRSASSDKDASTADIQENDARRTVDGSSLGGLIVSQEGPSKAVDQQSSRRSTTTTPDDQTSRTNGELRTDDSREEGEGCTKRKRSTGDFGTASRRNGGQNQSTQKKWTKPQNNKNQRWTKPQNNKNQKWTKPQNNENQKRAKPQNNENQKFNKNAPKGWKYAGRGQILGTNGNAGKNNKHQSEQFSQPHNQDRGGLKFSPLQSYTLSSTAPLYQPTQQQSEFPPIPSFSTYREFQHPWSHGQIREPYIAYSGYQEDHAHPHQVYAYQTFEQPRYTRDTAPKQFFIDQQPTQRDRSHSWGSASIISENVQPMNQAFTSGADRTCNNLQASRVNALHYPLIVGSVIRTSSPIPYAPRTAPQSSMASKASPGVTSVTTTTISTTSQGAECISEVQEFKYNSDVRSAGKDSIKSDIKVGGLDNLTRIERCQTIPVAYSVDLELGIKPLNRHGTYPQGGAINWKILVLEESD